MNTVNEARRLKRAALFRAAALGLVILLAGIFIGSGATLVVVKRQSPSPRGMEFINERMIRSLKGQLELTAAQEEKIELICKERVKALSMIREEARPKIEKEVNRFNEDVKAVLDPHQRHAWEQIIKQFKDRFKSHKPGFGPPSMRRRGPYERPRPEDKVSDVNLPASSLAGERGELNVQEP